MTTWIYPTHRQLTVLFDWSRHGAQALAPELPGRAKDYERKKNMAHLRKLIYALDLDPSFKVYVDAVCRRDIGELSGELFGEIYRAARYHGYITRECRPVPLNGRQLHLIRLLSWGATMAEAAGDLEVNASSIAEVAARAREANGCATNIQLISCAYRNEWLPGHEEMRKLMAEQSPRLIPRGYRRED